MKNVTSRSNGNPRVCLSLLVHPDVRRKRREIIMETDGKPNGLKKKTIHQPNNTPPSSERGRLERLHARIRTDRIDRVIGYTHVRCAIYILLSLWTVVAHARKH